MSVVTEKLSTHRGDWRRVLSPTGNFGDAIFRILMTAVAFFVVAIVVGMILTLGADSLMSIRQFGFGFLTGQQWNPVRSQFGALPFIYGTVMS